jgi:hypothetical protein
MRPPEEVKQEGTHPLSSKEKHALIARWREDPGGTYRTWFLWEERLKNFRSIRRGIAQVVAEIEKGAFGNVYKGSSLETVVGSISEQRQIFKGADHAFLWKPKLRIPDIYESRDNQTAFGRFLDLVAPDGREEEVRAQLRRPAFSRVAELDVRYMPYGELERQREAMARFGTGMKAVDAIARKIL